MTMTLPDLQQGCPPRFSTRRNRNRPTLGPQVAKVAEQFGLPLMPWQRHVADVALEVDPSTGRLAYREVVVTIPRQNGKTSLLLPVTTHRAQMCGMEWGGRQRITYTAQSRNDARQKWEDEWLPLLDHSLFRSLYRVRKTNGSEAILWKNGSILDLMATTESAGHGKTRDLGVVDEAFKFVDARVEQAMKPSMITRPSPQLWVVSTAGTVDSTYLKAKVDAGRERVLSGDPSSVAYFEWSAADDMDRADPATWAACMPALGHTISPGGVRSELESMDAPEFDRAYLNRWNPNRTASVIPADAWGRACDLSSKPGAVLRFCADASPDLASAALAVASLRPDGRYHLEVIDHRPGTQWLAARTAEVVGDRGNRVALIKGSPAGSLRHEFTALGVEIDDVLPEEFARACGSLMTLVSDGGRVAHLGQGELDAAVDGAGRVYRGDAWVWSRRSSSADVCPLVAVTGALAKASEPDPAASEPFFAWT